MIRIDDHRDNDPPTNTKPAKRRLRNRILGIDESILGKVPHEGAHFDRLALMVIGSIAMFATAVIITIVTSAGGYGSLTAWMLAVALAAVLGWIWALFEAGTVAPKAWSRKPTRVQSTLYNLRLAARLILGGVLAFVFSLALTAAIMNADVENLIRGQKDALIEEKKTSIEDQERSAADVAAAEFAAERDALTASVTTAETSASAAWDSARNAQNECLGETGGTTGSGRAGYGVLAEMKCAAADAAREDAQTADGAVQAAKDAVSAVNQKIRDRAEQIKSDIDRTLPEPFDSSKVGIVDRVTASHEVLGPWAWLVVVALWIVDGAALLYKAMSGHSTYEVLLGDRETQANADSETEVDVRTKTAEIKKETTDAVANGVAEELWGRSANSTVRPYVTPILVELLTDAAAGLRGGGRLVDPGSSNLGEEAEADRSTTGAPSHDPSPRRQARRGRLIPGTAVVVAILMVATATVLVSRKADSSSAPASASIETVAGGPAPSTIELTGDSVTLDVDPSTPIDANLPGVGSLSAPAGSVSAKGTMTISTPSADNLPAGVVAAGRAIEVAFDGTQLTRPLDLSFEVNSAPAEGMLPVVAHSTPAGWEIEAAESDGTHTTQSAQTFSIRVPAWLNPINWLHDIGDKLTSVIAGRTQPEACPNNAPSWGSANNETVTTHLCTISNPDPATGEERLEVRLKSNRPAWLEVTVPDGVDYVWTDGVPDFQRKVLALASGGDSSHKAFLPPGGLITIGFRQPSSPAEPAITVRNTQLTEFITLLGHLTELLGANIKGGNYPSYMGNTAAIALAIDCGVGQVSTSPGLDDVAGALKCLVGNVATSLAKPEVALASARNILGPGVDQLTLNQQTEVLTSVGGKLATLGFISSVVGLWPAVRSVLSPLADGIVEAFTNGGGTLVRVSLDARKPAPGSPSTELRKEGLSTTPPTTTPPTTTPPTTTPPTTTPPPTTPPTTTPPRRTATAEVWDNILLGTWLRRDTSDGVWWGKAQQPPNGQTWAPNGTKLTVDCTAQGAPYKVVYSSGAATQTWDWWVRTTGGVWWPVAATKWAQPVDQNSPYPGLDIC